MKATCAVCDRAIGPCLSRCPYCGGPISEPLWYREARIALSGVILLSLTWAASRHPSTARPLCERLHAMLHHPLSALLLAVALTIACFPLAHSACRPGAPTPATRWQTGLAGIHSLLFAAALVVCTVLLGHSRQTAYAALPAFAALLVYPRLMRIPAYPLLAVPVIALAWALGAT